MKKIITLTEDGKSSNVSKLFTEFKCQESERLKEIQSVDKSINCKYTIKPFQKIHAMPRYSNPSGSVDLVQILADLLDLEESYINSKLYPKNSTLITSVISDLITQNLHISFKGVLDLYPITHQGGKVKKDPLSSKRSGKLVTKITKDRITVKAVIKKSLRVASTSISKDLKTTDIF